MWLPLIDGLTTHLDERFPETPDHSSLGLVTTLERLIPARLHQMDEEEVLRVAAAYECDVPSPNCLRSELLSWKTRWGKKLMQDRPADALVALGSCSLPNIRALLQLLCTLPVTACEPERTFSAVAKVKDISRSTMEEERLEGLVLVYVHPTISITKTDM